MTFELKLPTFYRSSPFLLPSSLAKAINADLEWFSLMFELLEFQFVKWTRDDRESVLNKYEKFLTFSANSEMQYAFLSSVSSPSVACLENSTSTTEHFLFENAKPQTTKMFFIVDAFHDSFSKQRNIENSFTRHFTNTKVPPENCPSKSLTRV